MFVIIVYSRANNLRVAVVIGQLAFTNLLDLGEISSSSIVFIPFWGEAYNNN